MQRFQLHSPFVSQALILLLFLCSFGAKAQQNDDSPDVDGFFSKAQTFFRLNVQNQRVNYKGIAQNTGDLDILVDQISNMDVEALAVPQQKAFLINAYNVLVIKNVIDHYPITSPEGVPGFFTGISFKVGGKKMTLDALEKKWIFKDHPDPRLHFVLVCGALGCPPLEPFAYMPETLEPQMEKQTTKALNDPGFIRLYDRTKSLQISMIFQWYASDFGGSEKAVRSYISGYRKAPLPDDFELRYYPYNWMLNELQVEDEQLALTNVQKFTPSALLAKGQFEVKFFNNVYTHDSWFDADAERTSVGEQQSFFTSQTSVLVGVSKNSSLNVGFDFLLRRSFYDSDTNGSFLKAFSLGNTDSSRTAVTAFGPKVKFQPFKSFKRFSVQSALWIPLASDLEGQPWTDFQRLTWWNQFFIDKSFLDNKFQAFFEADLLFRIPMNEDTREVQLFTPVTAIGSWFPTNKSTVYLLSQYAPLFNRNTGALEVDQERVGFPGYFLQGGIGAKYQILPALEIELLYSNFVLGRAQGAGETFNIGLRYLR